MLGLGLGLGTLGGRERDGLDPVSHAVNSMNSEVGKGQPSERQETSDLSGTM